MSDALLVPPHLLALGRAFEAVAGRFARKAAAPAPMADRVVEMRDVLPAYVLRLQGITDMLSHELERLTAEVVDNPAVSETQVLALVTEFESQLGQIAELLVAVRGLRVRFPEEEGRRLLAGVYQYFVQQILAWMRELAATVADPQEALRKRGLPTSGGAIEIPLTLSLTPPQDLYDLRIWAEQRGHAVPPCRGKDPLGFWAKLGLVAIGWSLLS